MNEQKDNKIDNAGHSYLSDVQAFNNDPIYDFINRKTEKLVTALYMVTDCMDYDEALKNKLRSTGVELLADAQSLFILSSTEKYSRLNISIARINAIISLIEITSIMGFISDMNAGILKREFGILSSELKTHLEKRQHLTFVLDNKMFDIPHPLQDNKGHISIGHYKGQDKGQDYNGQKSDPDNYQLPANNNYQIEKKDRVQSFQSKQDRTDKILSIIKEKNEVSIKEISTAFSDCSEKTIQRELNSLVFKGQLKRVGEKRWSRYSLVS